MHESTGFFLTFTFCGSFLAFQISPAKWAIFICGVHSIKLATMGAFLFYGVLYPIVIVNKDDNRPGNDCQPKPKIFFVTVFGGMDAKQKCKNESNRKIN